MFGKRILIAVPHPDDEVVACAAAISRAQKEGAEIFALYLTHGCIARETLWPWQRRHYEAFSARRRAEAKEAAQFLGITPIEWSPRPARHLWRELPQVQSELEAAVTQNNIDQLWVPAYEGGNADHDGLNAVASLLMYETREKRKREKGQKTEQGPLFSFPYSLSSVLEFAEYNYFGGVAHAQEFPYPNGTETIITLTPEERARKRAALAIYKSEKLNLNYVGIERECFRPLAAQDYSRLPHPGTLWYARFQWVPFRHPRVDFTKPEEVSAAITAFLKASVPLAPATPQVPEYREADRGSAG